MANLSIQKLAYYLALIGGALLILFHLIGFLGMAISIPFGVPLRGMSFGFAFLPLIIGVVAVVVAKRSAELLWAIVLIVAGYIAGGIGGLLVLLGGLLGLLSKLAR